MCAHRKYKEEDIMKKLLSLVLICLLAIPSFAGAEVFEASAGGFGGVSIKDQNEK